MEGKVTPQRGAASTPPPPVELSAGFNATVQVGGSFWWLRRVRLYADAFTRRYQLTAFLERRPDQQGDPLEPDARSTLELQGRGETLELAARHLLEELTRPNPLLLAERVDS